MHYYTDVLKKYAIFSGRARRKEYWMFTLFNVIISIVISIIGGLIFRNSLNFIYYIYLLAVLLPGIAVMVRRLHDTSRSAHFLWFLLIPFVGPIIVIVFLFLDSTPGDNRYGPNPKGLGAPLPPSQPVS